LVQRTSGGSLITAGAHRGRSPASWTQDDYRHEQVGFIGLVQNRSGQAEGIADTETSRVPGHQTQTVRIRKTQNVCEVLLVLQTPKTIRTPLPARFVSNSQDVFEPNNVQSNDTHDDAHDDHDERR